MPAQSYQNRMAPAAKYSAELLGGHAPWTASRQIDQRMGQAAGFRETYILEEP